MYKKQISKLSKNLIRKERRCASSYEIKREQKQQHFRGTKLHILKK